MVNKALIIAKYLKNHGGELPTCFMSKSIAKREGWHHGALSIVLPGHYIGGDEFMNREGLLPAGETYYECDICTPTTKRRGKHRLVYSDKQYFYTSDHYKTFSELDPR